jgi:hypothetical protein
MEMEKIQDCILDPSVRLLNFRAILTVGSALANRPNLLHDCPIIFN